jgi:asparagine synthase (glutamine-hydrolysing)
MCGICGVYNAWSGEPIQPALIERMMTLIHHRGPDDSGAYVDGAVGLGSTRLSIIDLIGGHQPMCNETGDVWIVFNGEIWNYRTLRKDLMEKEHVFRTHCDTETIVHAYEEYGVECIARLHGMFGLAIWDAKRRRLLLARDRVGKKPLYYARVDGGLIFASEIKAILCHPDVKRQADPQALADFLSVRYVPGPATLFAAIRKVLPGHWLLCENGQIREKCYWDFTFKETAPLPVDEYVQGVREHVHRAVEERMMADVPVGALLSGGVDSSIVAGTMSHMTSQPVKTFAVGFDVRGFSELPYAQLVAKHFGTEHHELVVQSSDLSQWWPVLTWHRDEPVSEPSDLGVYLISKLARRHVKVVLTGEGGDELFAGYPKYVVDWLARYYHILPAALRDQVITSLLDRLPYSMRKVKMAARVLSQPAPERWMNWFGIFNGRLKEQLLSATTKASIDCDSSRVFRRWLENNPQRDDVSSMLYLDTKIWLPDNLLMKSDKMTMAASLEARVPLLDASLIEYAASIPTNVKIKPFRAKYLFKRAFADFLPEAILTRKKMGFNVPTSTWFRERLPSLMARLLLSDRARSRGFLDDACVARLVRDHVEARTDYGNQLFLLASLELWFRVFIDTASLEYPRGSLEEYLEEEQPAVSRA